MGNCASASQALAPGGLTKQGDTEDEAAAATTSGGLWGSMRVFWPLILGAGTSLHGAWAVGDTGQCERWGQYLKNYLGSAGDGT